MLGKAIKNFDMLPPEVKNATMNATDRFEAVLSYLENNKSTKRSARTAIAELKLQLCFPRLDVNVSKDLNHLLKSLFCVHPKTGQVCVPFEADKAFEFQPTQVPTILTLMDELHALDRNARSLESVDGSKNEKVVLGALSDSDYEKTSLAPYTKVFRRFVHKLMKQKKESLSKTGQTISSDAKRARMES